MPSGVFQVVAVIGDDIIYHSTKPVAGDLASIEKRTLAMAIRKTGEDVDPASIQVYALPYFSIEALKHPPRPVEPRREVPTKTVVAGRAAHHTATHPTEGSIKPKFYKPT